LCGVALAAVVAAAQDSRPSPSSKPAQQPVFDDAAIGDGPDDVLSDGIGDDDLELFDLDVRTVVTAGRREQKASQVPHAISVITREDIRRSGARSVPDALRLATGIDVADLSYGNAAVSPRGAAGFLSRETLVLVDGRQIFDSFFGGTLWGSWPFQLEDIERIEVVRGPGGVAWGANAVSGVINIITRPPGRQRELTFVGGGGSRGTYHQYMRYTDGGEGFRFRISGGYEHSDGFLRGGSLLRGPDDEYSASRGAFAAEFDLSPTDTLSLSVGSGVVEDGFPRSPLAGFGDHKGGSEANFALGRWRRITDAEHEYEITGYFNDFAVSPAMAAVDYRYQQYALQFSATLRPNERHTWQWGVDGRLDTADASNSDPFMLTDARVTSGIIGAYVQDEWRLAPRWSLNVGARIDYDSNGGFQPSARAALSYALSDDAMIYGAVSRAFQMPPAALRHVNTPFLNGLARATTDGKLKATTLMAYEVGYRTALLDRRLRIAVDAFWHEMWDVTTLSARPGPPGLIWQSLANRASQSLYGVEFESRFALTDATTLLGNYTYQQLEWESVAPYHDHELIFPPKHKLMLGVRHDLTDDLHVAAHAWWVDATRVPNSKNPFVSRAVDPYWRLDVSLEYEFWNDNAALQVGVRSLIDDHHPEGGTLFLNRADTPRMIYAQLRLTFR
ncbi:MAG: TonB-dependent receptor, partial [Planctomycetota bacterium]